MEFPNLLIKQLAVFTDLHILTVVPLIGRNKFNAAVATLVVVAIHKIYNQQPGLLLAGE